MLFEVGARVKWKDSCPIRLGFARSDEGRVVGLENHQGQGDQLQIDVAFDNGEVIHGAAGTWFEKVQASSAN